MSWSIFLFRLRRTVRGKSTKDNGRTVGLCLEEMEARDCPGNLLSCNGDGALMNLGLDLTEAESAPAMPSIFAGATDSSNADVLLDSAFNQDDQRESVSTPDRAPQSEQDDAPRLEPDDTLFHFRFH